MTRAQSNTCRLMNRWSKADGHMGRGRKKGSEPYKQTDNRRDRKRVRARETQVDREREGDRESRGKQTNTGR